ncbi:MAG TPA: DUF1499 domain-containing protein [Beijerinckiaceae bacterium]|nr:DUF1499 domain-containing protein [Beijerinckiaceae bacterium]
MAIALALAGMIGAHFGFMPAFFGFQLLLLGFFVSILGLLAAIIAMLMTFLMAGREAGRSRAVVGFILCLAVIIPIAEIVATTRKYPLINDITTDTKNPPEFVAAGKLSAGQVERMQYDSAKYAAAQQSAPAYGGLGPLRMDGQLDDVFKKAQIIAGEFPGWQITDNDPRTRTIEGVATSTIFHFKDDFVIQVRPAPEGGSLIEMRSKSRDGTGDLGANYNRIKSFFAAMQGPPRGVPVDAQPN